MAVCFQFFHPWWFDLPLNDWQKLCIGVGITTFSWLLVTFLTQPADEGTLPSFYRLVKPGGPGWSRVVNRGRADGDLVDEGGGEWSVAAGILCMAFGCFAVYGAVFATGHFVHGNTTLTTVMVIISTASLLVLTRLGRKLGIRWSHPPAWVWISPQTQSRGPAPLG